MNNELEVNLKGNVSIDVLETEFKRVYLVIKNNNEETVRVNIKMNFYDENGSLIEYKPSFGHPKVHPIAPHQELIESNYDYAPNNYASYDIEYDVTPDSQINYYDQMELLSQERIYDNVTFGMKFEVKNNAQVKIDYIRIDVVYYNEGKFVGVGTSTTTAFEAGTTTTMKALNPTDRDAHAQPFDDYKAYVVAYNYDL